MERIDASGGSPAVFQASIGSLIDGEISRSGHSVYVAGVILDPQASAIEDQYKGIVIIDSDNDAQPSEKAGQIVNPTFEEKQEDKAARPNSCTFYPLKYIYDINGTPCWEIVGYHEGETEILYAVNALELPGDELIAECTETEGNCSVADMIDLTLDSAITTDETEAISDFWQYTNHESEYRCTEFQKGQPVNVNYFVTNRSGIILDEEYMEGKDLTIGWTVSRDSDGAVVGEGMAVFDQFLYSRSEMGSMIHLNQQNDTIAEWEAGTYTVTLRLNPDRAIREAYYRNNIDRVLSFTIVDSGDSEEVIPTEEPTPAPTEEATPEPTETPTEAPTEEPTEEPAEKPTEVPTITPTKAPTLTPTEKPSIQPTQNPKRTPDTGDAASDIEKAAWIALIISGTVFLAASRKKLVNKR